MESKCTLITEWHEGAQKCVEILESPSTIDLFTTQLAKLTKHFGFDGWLVNIENIIKSEHVEPLQSLVRQLTLKCHDLVLGSEVIWYDSVISSGELKWQDELNLNNKLFFDVCDGIFLNYNLTKKKLAQSHTLAVAEGRELDVYAGIDVYGRQTPCGGGFNCRQDLSMILGAGLSVALFAFGWVYEVLKAHNFDSNEVMFWGLLSPQLPAKPLDLPVATSFCQGFGNRVFLDGKVVSQETWQNLSVQQVQPSFSQSQFSTYTVRRTPKSSTKDCTNIKEQGFDQKGNDAKVEYDTAVDCQETHPASPRIELDLSDGYYGGSCLKLTLKPRKFGVTLFRLFKLNVTDLSKLRLTLVWKLAEHHLHHTGLVLFDEGQNKNTSAIVCTATQWSETEQKDLISNLAKQEQERMSLDVSNFTSFSTEHGENEWRNSTMDLHHLAEQRPENKAGVFTLAVFYASNHNSTSNDDGEESVRLGYLQISDSLGDFDTNVKVTESRLLHAKFSSTLSESNLEKIVNCPIFHYGFQELDEADSLPTPSSKEVDEIKAVGPSSSKKARSNVQSGSLYEMKTDSNSQPLNSVRCTLNFIDPSVEQTETKSEDKGATANSTDLCSKAEVGLKPNETCQEVILLKWELSSTSDIAFCHIFAEHKDGRRTLIGQSVNNCFVYKPKDNMHDVKMFHLLPVFSKTGLPSGLMCLANC